MVSVADHGVVKTPSVQLKSTSNSAQVTIIAVLPSKAVVSADIIFRLKLSPKRLFDLATS